LEAPGPPRHRAAQGRPLCGFRRIPPGPGTAPRAAAERRRRAAGMTLTGRAAVAAVIGALIVLAFRNVAALVVVDAVILAAIAADLLLAAPVRPLRLARAGDSTIRLGHAGDGTPAVDNPSTRSLRATVRDACPPLTSPR